MVLRSPVPTSASRTLPLVTLFSSSSKEVVEIGVGLVGLEVGGGEGRGGELKRSTSSSWGMIICSGDETVVWVDVVELYPSSSSDVVMYVGLVGGEEGKAWTVLCLEVWDAGVGN